MAEAALMERTNANVPKVTEEDFAKNVNFTIIQFNFSVPATILQASVYDEARL